MRPDQHRAVSDDADAAVGEDDFALAEILRLSALQRLDQVLLVESFEEWQLQQVVDDLLFVLYVQETGLGALDRDVVRPLAQLPVLWKRLDRLEQLHEVKHLLGIVQLGHVFLLRR